VYERGSSFDPVMFLISYAITGILVGLLANRKNRNPWAWGMFGGLFCVPTLLVMAFMSYLCPRCRSKLTNEQWAHKMCPKCGAFGGAPSASPSALPPTSA
jgi:uncharacterized membrane protein YeiB